MSLLRNWFGLNSSSNSSAKVTHANLIKVQSREQICLNCIRITHKIEIKQKYHFSLQFCQKKKQFLFEKSQKLLKSTWREILHIQ
jgi:hypothetical protein